MKKLFFIIGICMYPQMVQQHNNLKILKGSFQEVAIDGKLQMYLFDKTGVLSLYDTALQLKQQISYAQYGNHAWLDVSNRLENFLFFPEISKLLILDNQLNLQQEIDMAGFLDIRVSGFSRSSDGSFWFYDGNRERLINYSRKGEKLQESMQLFEKTSLTRNRIEIWDLGKQIFLFNGREILILDRNLNIIKKNTAQNVSKAGGTGWIEQKDKYLIFNSWSQTVQDTLSSSWNDTLQLKDYREGFLFGTTKYGVFLQSGL